MDQHATSAIYPLFGLSGEKLQSTLTTLKDYWKAKSIIYLNVLGLPTLKAVAVTNWNVSIKRQLMQFLNQEGWTSVVIRTDRKGGMGVRPPLGGYLIKLVDLDKEVQKFLAENRIVMLLEPRDRYRNLYSINVMFESTSPDILYLEIVGPGFDVSDINRGDVTPHERIWIQREARADIRIVKHSITSAEDYRNSVGRRLLKIGRLVAANESVNRVVEKEAELGKLAKQFLETNGYDLLLGHSDSYQPIPVEYLRRVIQFIAGLPEKMSRQGLDTNVFVISSTIFEGTDELVFWDIVWPRRKLGDSYDYEFN